MLRATFCQKRAGGCRGQALVSLLTQPAACHQSRECFCPSHNLGVLGQRALQSTSSSPRAQHGGLLSLRAFHKFIHSFILWVRGALLPFSMPPTNLAWQIPGFLDALGDSQTPRGCTANTHRGGPSLSWPASQSWCCSGRMGQGVGSGYGLEPANAQTWARSQPHHCWLCDCPLGAFAPLICKEGPRGLCLWMLGDTQRRSPTAPHRASVTRSTQTGQAQRGRSTTVSENVDLLTEHVSR